MMKCMSKIAGALFVLAIVVVPVRAGLENEKIKAEAVLGKAIGTVKKFPAKVHSIAAKFPGVPSRGTYGKDHCSPYDATEKPVNDGNGDGENGYYCVPRVPFSVTCKVLRTECGWEGDSGYVCRNILGACNPPGGFAGTPLPGTGEQAP